MPKRAPRPASCRTVEKGSCEDATMNCRACQRWLQQRLDDGSPLEATYPHEIDLGAHLAHCPACASRLVAARRLLEGLHRSSPRVPVDLTDRIVRRVLAEQRPAAVRQTQRWRRFLPLAVAAGLLLVLGVLGSARYLRGPAPVQAGVGPRSGDTPGEVVLDGAGSRAGEDERPTPVRDSVAEAGLAVANLTTRTADATLGPTGDLWPMLSAPPLTPMEIPPPVEPEAAGPLVEAGAEVSAGLEPVASSARRALGMFLGQLPRGLENAPANKPG